MDVNNLVTAFAITLTASSLLRAGPINYITDLGLVGAGTATGISAGGHVTGWRTDAFGNLSGFLYHQGTLQELSRPPGAGGVMATGVNRSGQVAGTAFGPAGTQATVWNDTTPQPVAGALSYATAINDYGHITGAAAGAAGNNYAFRLGENGLENLGALGGGFWSSGYGINSAGHVVGTSQTAGGAFHAFLWTPGQGMCSLGTLGGSSSYATGINDSGVIIGHAATPDGWLQAFLFSNGVMSGLGTLGGSQSYAYGINSGGLVVGYSWLAGNERTSAFVLLDGALRDLNSLVPDGSGWTLLEAYGINDFGQVVGAGLYEGERRAFLLNLPSLLIQGDGPAAHSPEPSTVALLAGGLALFAAGRMGKRRLSRKPSSE